MQINGTNSLNAMQYAQMQNTQTNTVKSTSSQNTLQSDMVTLSAEAMNLTPELHRGGGNVITKREED
ncbi:hypothetical protein [Pseudoalteromonas sp.]|uniref:hypothetical protein n=1 Tax=Pseudoalteromonas sp. TaxID=53249 RepID=UPI00356B578B